MSRGYLRRQWGRKSLADRGKALQGPRVEEELGSANTPKLVSVAEPGVVLMELERQAGAKSKLALWAVVMSLDFILIEMENH